MGAHTTIYRYGLITWVWRVLLAVALIGGTILLVAARSGTLELALIAVAFVVPGIFFGTVVATRVDRLDNGHVQVWTLLFWRRHVLREHLSAPRLYPFAQLAAGSVYAPRVWVPVHRRLPIYLDLLAYIPNRDAFLTTFRLPGSALPLALHPEQLPRLDAMKHRSRKSHRRG